MSTPEIPPSCIILLNGFPGVGKLTIARALQSTFPPDHPARLIDNHTIIDLAVLSVPKRTPAYYAHRASLLRSAFFDHIPATSTVIMTAGFAAEPPHDVAQWADHVAVAREKGMCFVHINVGCAVGINEERLVTVERVEGREKKERGGEGKMKCVRVERLRELRGATTMLDPRKNLGTCEGVDVFYFELDSSGQVGESVEMLWGFLREVGVHLTKNQCVGKGGVYAGIAAATQVRPGPVIEF